MPASDEDWLPRSLVHATDIDVLPPDRELERHDGYLVIRSPSNPQHYWGNLLLFDDPPRHDDGARWERLFDEHLGRDPRVCHRAFAWDRVDASVGCARREFVCRGYRLEDTVGLVAAPGDIRAHPRANRSVIIRALDPAVGRDERWRAAVIEVQVAGREEGLEEGRCRTFSESRMADLRRLFRGGRGAWYVAHYPGCSDPVACCGVVITGTRGRFQAVDTAIEHRRKGICSKLVVEAVHHRATTAGIESFVIAADANYHALGLYESLGFVRRENVCGVCQWPQSDHARL